MTRTRFFGGLAVVVGLSLGVAPSASAQPRTEKQAIDTRAHELFQKGDAAYAEGRYEEARANFQEAYELSGRPQLLFNLSNSLERLGRYSEAVEALEKYLASGKARDQEIVEKRLANLRRRVEEQKKVEEQAKQEEERKRAAEEKQREEERKARERNQPPAQPPPDKPTRVLPILLLGGSAVAFATAGVAGAITLTARRDAEKGCTDVPTGRFCTDDVGASIERDKTFGLVTDIALASGIVLGVAGVISLFVKPKSEDKVRAASRPALSGRQGFKPEVRAVTRSSGAGVEVFGSF